MAPDHRPLGIAVAGLGAFARSQYLPNISRIPELELIGLYNRNPERLRTAADRWPAPVETDCYDDLLADERIDVVVVAAADAIQADLTIRALQAGKHVMVEKPLAETPEGIAAVEAAQNISGKRVAVGFNRRFAPIFQDLKADLTACGGFTNAQYRFVDDACLRWGADLEDGCLIVHDCCHLFDLFRWLSGTEITRIACLSARPDDESMLLQLEDGAIVSIQLSGHTCMELPKEQAAWYGTKGAWEMTDFVELRRYGFPEYDGAELRRYRGHCHPDAEFGHTELYAQLGAEALRAYRRQTSELRRAKLAGELTGTRAGDAERYLGNNIPTFSVDKGWIPSLQSFAQAIQRGEASDHATPADALQASRIAAAAVHSRHIGGAFVEVAPVSAQAL